MYLLIITVAAFVVGVLLSRFAYLMFTDFRRGLNWLGFTEDSNAAQVRLLTFGGVATIAASILALFDGHNFIVPMVATPFFFVLVAEIIFLLHRLFGTAFEDFVLKLHPVDIFYGLLKRSMSGMWSQNGRAPGKCDTAGCDKETSGD